jgi:sulfite exporter TauE/SafE
MGIGTSIFLIAVGAILRYAVSATATGFSIHTVGLILMIVGVIGLLISLAWLASINGRRRPAAVVDPYDRPVVREPDVY